MNLSPQTVAHQHWSPNSHIPHLRAFGMLRMPRHDLGTPSRAGYAPEMLLLLVNAPWTLFQCLTRVKEASAGYCCMEMKFYWGQNKAMKKECVQLNIHSLAQKYISVHKNIGNSLINQYGVCEQIWRYLVTQTGFITQCRFSESKYFSCCCRWWQSLLVLQLRWETPSIIWIGCSNDNMLNKHCAVYFSILGFLQMTGASKKCFPIGIKFYIPHFSSKKHRG